MEIELYPILSTVILASTVMTIVFAMFSYVLFRVRESKAARRRQQTAPPAEEPQVQGEPVRATAAKAAAASASSASSTDVREAERQAVPAKPRFFRPYEPAL